MKEWVGIWQNTQHFERRSGHDVLFAKPVSTPAFLKLMLALFIGQLHSMSRAGFSW